MFLKNAIFVYFIKTLAFFEPREPIQLYFQFHIVFFVVWKRNFQY